MLSGVLLAGIESLWVVTALLFLTMSFLSLVFGNVVAVAMNAAPGQTGSASSLLLGVLQYVFGGVAGVIMGLYTMARYFRGDITHGCAIGALLSGWYASRQAGVDSMEETLTDSRAPE
ncbi:hypothetical protein [Pectobacterium brasiliense]|uniref:hypothetical protein n=1 Tax=Pectobacterium brasiliense TaxID=180957 RepID=UPI001F07698A|nr:hypothetical protein [Pectobacterium brasiliense]